jgi:FG-GAP-like repeat
MPAKCHLPLLSSLIAVSLVPGAMAKGFLTGTNYPSGELPSAAVVRDLNNDQVADIVSANTNDGNLTVFLGRGDGRFDPTNTFRVGADAVELASADLNGDGKADLAVTDGIKSLYVVLGNGDGTFGAPTTYRLNNDPIGVVIADLNGDGKPDLAVADFGPENNSQGDIAILLGSGDGTFAAPVFYKINNNANRLVAVDLNGDAKLDLAVAIDHFSNPRDSLAVLLGNGDGTFQAATTSIAGSATDVAAGDFNNDGKVDLALAGQYANLVRVALGNGNGTFQPAMDYPTNGTAVTISAADLNRDGNLDLLVGGATVAALLGNGDGTFASAVNYAIGNRFAQVGYLNSDQALDVVSGGGFSAIGVAFGNGDGTFRAPLTYPVGSRIDGFDTADFNGDGQTDAVFGRLGDGGSKLALLFGTGHGDFTAGPSFGDFTAGSVRAADFNGDGKEDVLAILFSDNGFYIFLGNADGTFQTAKFISVPGSDESVAIGDFNHDGKPDVAMAIYFSDRLAILLGNGDGTFQSPMNLSTSKGPGSPVVSDFNGDGNPDVAVAGTTISVYLGTGDGTFQAPLTIADSGLLAPGDFNRDGVPDLVVSGGDTAVLLGNGDGTFQMPQTIFSKSGPLRVADANGDGRLDVVVSANFDELVVVPGRGDGTFLPGRVFATGSQFTGDVRLNDLNGDGLPEVIVSNISNSLSVLINTTRHGRP